MSNNKKMYVQPTVALLGSVAEKTQAGLSPSTDVVRGQNNTAFPVGS